MGNGYGHSDEVAAAVVADREGAAAAGLLSPSQTPKAVDRPPPLLSSGPVRIPTLLRRDHDLVSCHCIVRLAGLSDRIGRIRDRSEIVRARRETRSDGDVVVSAPF
jgi:hypothetical protein